MSSCGFKNLVSTPCGPSKYAKRSKESVIIRNCCKEIKGHFTGLEHILLRPEKRGKANSSPCVNLFVHIFKS